MPWWNPFRAKPEIKSHGTFGNFGVFFPTINEPFSINRYEQFAFEGYKRNSTANTCVDLVSRAIATVPIKIFREREVAGQIEEVPDNNHPLWERVGPGSNPNERQSWLQFNQAYWTYFHINGNNYIKAAGDPNFPGALWPLRPDRVKPIFSNKAELMHWEHNVNGRIEIIPVEKLLHTFTFDPLNDFFGMPILEPAATEIDQTNNAGIWNNSQLKNGGRPSLFFGSKDGKSQPPTAAQEKMLRLWMDDSVTGPLNARKPLIMPGMEVTEVGKTAIEMDWLNGILQAMVGIANVCGVPPELIGIQGQKTYANYAEARKAFFQETVLPLADDIYKSLTQFLGGKFQGVMGREPVIIAVDRENVIALQESQDAKHARIRDDVKGSIITVNEGRDEFGLEPKEGGDEILVPANLIPLDLVVGGDEDGDILPDNQPLSEPVEEEEEDDEETNE